jgi:Aldehyde dehydrogenase family
VAASGTNLVPVTLELGGKSPAIIDESASIATAASCIAHGKNDEPGLDVCRTGLCFGARCGGRCLRAGLHRRCSLTLPRRHSRKRPSFNHGLIL